MTPLILTVVATIFTLIGLGGIYQTIQGSNFLWLLSWVPLGFMVIFIAPYKLWKEQQDKVKKFEDDLKPKLNITIEHEPFPTGGERKGYFWVLKVVNNGDGPVDRCYGIIKHCYLKGDNENRDKGSSIPKDGHRLPWAKQTGGGALEIRLGGGELAYLDYIMIRDKKSKVLRVPAFPNPPDTRPDYETFIIEHNNIEFEIAIGTRQEVMEPSIIRFNFEWQGADKAVITEISNTSPQVSDKENSQT